MPTLRPYQAKLNDKPDLTCNSLKENRKYINRIVPIYSQFRQPKNPDFLNVFVKHTRKVSFSLWSGISIFLCNMLMFLLNKNFGIIINYL